MANQVMQSILGDAEVVAKQIDDAVPGCTGARRVRPFFVTPIFNRVTLSK